MSEVLPDAQPEQEAQREASASHALRDKIISTVGVSVVGALFCNGMYIIGVDAGKAELARQQAAEQVAAAKLTECAPVAPEDIQFAKDAFARAESDVARYAPLVARIANIDVAEDKIINYIAKDKGLTIVSSLPTVDKLWQKPPNIKRDFAIANSFALKNYGVEISPLLERTESTDKHGEVVAINPFVKIDKKQVTPIKVRLTLNNIIEDLHHYPTEFVRYIGLKKIKIGAGDGAAGLDEGAKDTITIDANSASVLPHEVSHEFDDADCEGKASRDPGYAALNPAGFSYDDKENTVLLPSVEQTKKDKVPSLEEQSFTFSEYGKTNVVEDKADQGARLIGSRAYEILRSKSKIVKEKFFYLAGRMASTELGKRFVGYFAEINALDDY